MKKLRIVISVLVVLLTLAAAMTAMAGDDLKIVYNLGVAPLKFEDKSSQPAGLFPDLWRLWAQKTGKQIQFVSVDSFEESIQILKDGKADLHAGLFKTPEREEFLDYSDPLLKLNYYIFTHPSLFPINSLERTSGLLVGIQKGGYTEKLVRSKIPSNRIVVYDRVQDLMRAALEGEIKVFISTELSLLYYLKENWISNIFEYYQDRPLFSQVYYTATRKGNPELIQKVNDGLGAIGSGERKQLEEKWIVQDFREIPSELLSVLSDEERQFLMRIKKIKAQNDTANAPFNFRGNNQPKGFCIDYMQLLAKKAGLGIEFVTAPSLEEFLSMMKSGDLDVMLNVAKTPEKDPYLSFTRPYLTLAQALYTRKDFPVVQSIEDLYGKRIAVIKGSYLIEIFKRYPQVEVVEVTDIVDAIQAVSAGRADALHNVMPVVNYLMDNFQITNLKVGGDIGIEEIARPTPIHLAVRKDIGMLAGILEKAMSLISDAEYRALHDKWLGKPETIEATISLTRQKWLVEDVETPSQPTEAPISYERLIAYSAAVFLILSLLIWILFKTVKRENIAVSFGSRWFRMFVLAGLSFFVIIACLLGWFTLQKNKEKVLADIGENLIAILETANDRLELWVEQRTSFLKLLGRDPELVALTKRLLTVTPEPEGLIASAALQDIREFFKTNKSIFPNIGFFIIDTDHVSIASMRDTNIGTRNLISLQRPDLLRRAFQGDVLFVPPIESDVPLLENPDGKYGTRKPSTEFFIGPIQDTKGHIIAVMTLRVNPSTDFSRHLQPLEMRKSGETYAFSEQGELLSKSRFDEQLRRIGLIGETQQSAMNIEIRDPGVNLVKGHRPKTGRSEQPLTRMVDRALELKREMQGAGQKSGRSKTEIDTKSYRDYRGVTVFGAWLWNVDLGLGLAAEIDAEESLSTYHMTRLTVVGMLGFTLLMSVGGTLFILMIGERTNKALTRSRDDLEKRVDERTAELTENQEQLAAAEERSRLILDSAGEGIFGVNVKGICTFANPTALSTLGFSSEEILGRNIHSLIHHTHVDGSPYPEKTCPMSKAYAQGVTETISDEMLWRKDGTGFPVEYTATPVLQGTEITGAVITFRDITERKLMEDAITDERERLQKILDTSPVGVVISTENTIRFTNPRMTELTNLHEGDPATRIYVNADERRHVMEGVRKNGVVSDYELQAYGLEHEICDILGTFMDTEYEGKTGILGWLVDITGMKKAEKELRERFDELARFRRLAVGREKKMIDLKMEINELLKNSGLPEKYKIH